MGTKHAYDVQPQSPTGMHLGCIISPMPTWDMQASSTTCSEVRAVFLLACRHVHDLVCMMCGFQHPGSGKLSRHKPRDGCDLHMCTCHVTTSCAPSGVGIESNGSGAHTMAAIRASRACSCWSLKAQGFGLGNGGPLTCLPEKKLTRQVFMSAETAGR